MASWGLSKYIETKLQITCFHLILSLKKKKRDLELFSLPHFSHNFWRKIFFLLYTINWPGYIVWLPLLCEILGNISQIFWFFGLLRGRGRSKRTKTSQTKSSPKLKITCHVSYLRNCIVHDHDFWDTLLKWWYLQMCFSFFQNFDFLGC